MKIKKMTGALAALVVVMCGVVGTVNAEKNDEDTNISGNWDICIPAAGRVTGTVTQKTEENENYNEISIKSGKSTGIYNGSVYLSGGNGKSDEILDSGVIIAEQSLRFHYNTKDLQLFYGDSSKGGGASWRKINEIVNFVYSSSGETTDGSTGKLTATLGTTEMILNLKIIPMNL